MQIECKAGRETVKAGDRRSKHSGGIEEVQKKKKKLKVWVKTHLISILMFPDYACVCACVRVCAQFQGGEQYLMSQLWRPLNFNDAGDDIVCPSACYTDTSTP